MEGGVERVTVMDNEDDVVEVRLLVNLAWPLLSLVARRMIAVLAHSEGDDVDATSLAALAGAHRTKSAREAAAALRQLGQFHLVQEPLAGRFTVHAVVRQAIARRTHFAKARFARHYLRMLELHPERIALEQTHLFTAMDLANVTSDLGGALRIERLLARLDAPLPLPGKTRRA